MALSNSKLLVTTKQTSTAQRVTPIKPKAYATIRRGTTKKSYHNKETVTVMRIRFPATTTAIVTRN